MDKPQNGAETENLRKSMKNLRWPVRQAFERQYLGLKITLEQGHRVEVREVVKLIGAKGRDRGKSREREGLWGKLFMKMCRVKITLESCQEVWVLVIQNRKIGMKSLANFLTFQWREPSKEKVQVNRSIWEKIIVYWGLKKMKFLLF